MCLLALPGILSMTFSNVDGKLNRKNSHSFNEFIDDDRVADNIDGWHITNVECSQFGQAFLDTFG